MSARTRVIDIAPRLRPIADAALAFLDGLSTEQRHRAHQPLESDDWRTWINVHMNFFRHGVMLEDLDATDRKRGLDLIRSFDDSQRSEAILRDSIHPDDLPAELQHPFDGRMQAGAFNDNAVIPQAGVAATDLSDAQRQVLLQLIGTYVGWTRDGHAQVKMSEVARHLDDTSFSWMGATGDDGPFCYRVQSPVVLIEFDHHPGVVFDNRVPSRNHIHTLVRTPNGGDYGADLLRQHHDRFDHSHGDHRHRH